MRTIEVFLGGGLKLLHGENNELKGYRIDVIDPLVSQLNSLGYTKQLFIAKDYSDLTRNVVSGKQQEEYNKYILYKADIALFIIDGEIGNITKHEIDVAVSSTKKTKHPIVYIYGKNIKDDDLLDYLNQEGIYYQHFFDNRDLTTKIKADLDAATKQIGRRCRIRTLFLLMVVLLLCCSLYLFSIFDIDRNNRNESCSTQLYLMRYKDVNVLTGTNYYDNNLLSRFKYEDSIMTGTDIAVFPVYSDDSTIISTPPFFRLKLYNKNRNTIVLIEAILEVDMYNTQVLENKKVFIPVESYLPDVNYINIDGKTKEYTLKGFRQNVSFGETDDRYFFALSTTENCSFRMRVRVKSQSGDYLYSNYIYMNSIKNN